MHIQLADDQDYGIILSALKGFNSAFENKKIEKALNKVNLLSHASQEHIILDFSVLKEKEIINKNLLLLEKLILNQSVVEFDYTNSKNEFSQKKVDPIAIIYKWYSWYLVGCHSYCFIILYIKNGGRKMIYVNNNICIENNQFSKGSTII